MPDCYRTYYLTLSGPRRGERVVAGVNTSDRPYAEKLFGCGLRDEKDFGFDGLYTEEEVLHMFRPGTDIIGTFNAHTGGCEKHRNYLNMPLFEIRGGKAYRMKNNERVPVDLNVSDNSFDRVRGAISGKVQEAEKQETYESVISDAPADALAALDSGFSEPVFQENSSLPSIDAHPADFADIYTEIHTDRKSESDVKNDEFVSAFDAMFYGSQKRVIQSGEFSSNEKLRARFGAEQSGSEIGKRIQSFLGIQKQGGN